jgi:hypothetical protein
LNCPQLTELVVERSAIGRDLLERFFGVRPELLPLVGLILADRRAKLCLLKSFATCILLACDLDQPR